MGCPRSTAARGPGGLPPTSWRLSIQLLKEKSKLVRSAAARLSKEFGSAPEPETPRAPEKFHGGQAKSR